MTNKEHGQILSGVKSWLELLESGPAAAAEAVKVAMQVAIENLEAMNHCEGCGDWFEDADIENSRFCKLCVVIQDAMDVAWAETERDLRLGGVA